MTTYFDNTASVFYDVEKLQKSLERKRRSTCRLKSYESNTDYRTWSISNEQRRRNILERHNFLGYYCGESFPWNALLPFLCFKADNKIKDLGFRNSNKLVKNEHNNNCAECCRIMREIECCRNGCTNCHELKYNLDKCALWNEIYKIIYECDEFKDCFPDCDLNYGQWDDNGNTNLNYTPIAPTLSSIHSDVNSYEEFQMNEDLPCANPSCQPNTHDLTNIFQTQKISSQSDHGIDSSTPSTIPWSSVHFINFASEENCKPNLSNSQTIEDSNCEIRSDQLTHSQLVCPNTRLSNDNQQNSHIQERCLARVKGCSSSDSDLSQSNGSKNEDIMVIAYENQGGQLWTEKTSPVIDLRSIDFSCLLNAQDRNIVVCIKDKLYCIIDNLKHATETERESREIIFELKSNIDNVKERFTKQKEKFSKMASLGEQQQKHLMVMERLEDKLKDICQERSKLRCKLEDYTNMNSDEIDVLKKKQSSLLLQVKKLQIMENELNDVEAERVELCFRIKELEKQAREKDNKLSKLTDNLNQKEERICKLQKLVNCIEASDLHTTGDCKNNTNIRNIQEKMHIWKDKFLELENVILTQDKCLHEQHSYILEQEELRVCLQKKIKDLTLQHIQVLKERNSSTELFRPEFKQESKKKVGFVD